MAVTKVKKKGSTTAAVKKEKGMPAKVAIKKKKKEY